MKISSGLCKQDDFSHPMFEFWMNGLKETKRYHRKQWEFYFIIQALYDHGLLQPGRSGLGFGVGTEPLAAYFASHGVRVLATDQNLTNAIQGGWAQTDQHSCEAEQLNSRGICGTEQFRELVSFREVDMNAIPDDLEMSYDFCWSACSLEHLGSIEHGFDFIVNSINTLKPGGIAIHTTEYNLSSSTKTFESKHLSLFRKSDIERVCARLTDSGHTVLPIDWDPGNSPVDKYIDLPPYLDAPHLKLRIGEYDCTSIGLIIRRAS